MPDNSSAAKPESSSEPTELNFENAAPTAPRIKRRSLKAKPAGLIKPTAPIAAARELEREAPPLSAEQASRPAAAQPAATKLASNVKVDLTSKAAPAAPPRTTPSSATTTAGTQRPAIHSTSATQPASTAGTSKPASTSPHGTRPATLYYSSYPRKETSSSMKNATPASPATSPNSSSSSSAAAASATRPATAAASTTASRPSSPNIDYRANVDRQSREQKSVTSILSYVVYGLIAVFVLGAILAGYGAYTINKQLQDQSTTVTEIDSKYATAMKDLNAKLASTQESLALAQAQNNRQQDLINKQQEDISTLRAANADNASAIKAEKQARAQETATLRARVREVEKTTPTTQKY